MLNVAQLEQGVSSMESSGNVQLKGGYRSSAPYQSSLAVLTFAGIFRACFGESEVIRALRHGHTD